MYLCVCVYVCVCVCVCVFVWIIQINKHTYIITDIDNTAIILF